MSESKVQGRNVVLTAYNIDSYYGVYCAQSVDFTTETEQLPATSINGAGWKGNKPGKTSWEINLTGVLFVRDTSDKNWTFADLTTEQARKNGLDLKLVYTNENGNYEQFTGHANPQSITGSGTAGELAKFNVKFVGDGAYGRNTIIPPSTSADDVKRYEYLATGGETFFSYADLIGRTILEVQREATPTLAIITVGTPTPRQAKYTSASGRIDFNSGVPLDADEIVIVIYK
jgi:hypothetical protein